MRRKLGKFHEKLQSFDQKMKKNSTHELLLLIRHQLGDFILARCKFLLVVCEVANDKFLFARMKLELLGDLLEKRHIEESKILILCDERR